MLFNSTRGAAGFTSAQAIVRGIAADGGLFVPENFPRLSLSELEELVKMDYCGRAEAVLAKFLTDYDPEALKSCVRKAYVGRFDDDRPAPLKELVPGIHMLELWHGPTCAFKDMALQLLPHLLTTAANAISPGRTIVILVATSGDTGKAALEGFADVAGTKIIVFFPNKGVSPMQQLQMTTQAGENVAVSAINGNFDDAQTGVKKIFADEAMRSELAAAGMDFSSANSINFGRLVPQIVYYVSSYCELRATGKLGLGEAFNVTVPTGNFGNILAAYYAREMGVPIRKLVCGSNMNNILTDFIKTGVYDRNRPFYTTTSPSMDILISSNLERLLYHLSGSDAKAVAGWMNELKTTGRYEIPAELLAKLQRDFFGACCDEEGTEKTIREFFVKHRYLCDPHTAVAVDAVRQYAEATGDTTPMVIASTASPFKFVRAVLKALDVVPEGLDEFALTERLARLTGVPVPASLATLKSKAVRHQSCVDVPRMPEFIRSVLQ